MKNSSRWNITIIGAGKVGSTLGRILVENGEKIVCVVSRSQRSARSAGRFLKCKTTTTSLSAIPSNTNLVFIATPHATIESVGAGLAELEHLNFNRLSVCHASGMLTAAVLSLLAAKGATTFSFHPLQTFPRDFAPKDIVPTARNIYYGVDGDAKGLRVAKQFAKKLEGKVVEIPPEMRALYHATCVVASNHLTALLFIIEQMSAKLGLDRRKFISVFVPIIKATLNNVEKASPAKALSGPVARGGVETVGEHLASIKRSVPELLPYFTTLTAETIKLAQLKGSISNKNVEAMVKLIRSFTSNSSLPQEIH
ncbi:MAG: Rossmann-like and DUF2520 domain-containing protein [Bacteroidota bacterium]